MNIQIFGTAKCQDTRKAQRYFSDRRIKVQYIDLREKALSRGEFDAVKAALGSADALLTADCRDRDLLALVRYLTPAAREEKMFEQQVLLRTPIVRCGRCATVGYAPETWMLWEADEKRRP